VSDTTKLNNDPTAATINIPRKTFLQLFH